MMGWGIESVRCQGCIKEGEEDENRWRFVDEYLMQGVALGFSSINRGI